MSQMPYTTNMLILIWLFFRILSCWFSPSKFLPFMLREIKLSQMHKYCMIPLIGGSQNNWIHKDRMVVASTSWEQGSEISCLVFNVYTTREFWGCLVVIVWNVKYLTPENYALKNRFYAIRILHTQKTASSYNSLLHHIFL